jgi:hypothetical protein
MSWLWTQVGKRLSRQAVESASDRTAQDRKSGERILREGLDFQVGSRFPFMRLQLELSTTRVVCPAARYPGSDPETDPGTD